MMNRIVLFFLLSMFIGQAQASNDFRKALGDDDQTGSQLTYDFHLHTAQYTDVARYWQARHAQDSLQTATRTKAHYFLKKAILPTGLIAAGLVTMAVPRQTVLSKYRIHDTMHGWNPTFHTSADNYLQFAPAVVTLGLGAMGVKGRNDFLNQSLLFTKAELLMSVVVYGIKHATRVERPYGGVFTSFPSGHTAQAFLSATFLAKEYGHISPWISVAGYATATGVGVLRMMNNKHWISDVLAGAGVGILSVEFVYLTHQHRWGKKRNLVFAPTLYQKGGGVSMAMTF
ncbi:phosphatase PAP2 family protein [Prolixibacter sp. NT017]|uniref:phosphatase PAP2 family protein n=1 Tax=Prolixibacter sp. NT017 TaxID=2652390 RepID=UPI00188F2141|nr:phosphatase PAP2 family protein [Prolixibacter sp. NT017]